MARLITMRPSRAYIDGLKDLINVNFPDATGLVGIEIGSFQGESAEIMLSTGRIATLYCVDAWADGYDDADEASSQASIAERAFDLRFRDENRIVKVKGYSYDMAVQLRDGVDFIYVDGCHRPEAVTRDLQLYAPKVKNGGIIAGHDYEPRRFRPLMQAVDAFLGRSPEHVFCDFSWSCRKI